MAHLWAKPEAMKGMVCTLCLVCVLLNIKLVRRSGCLQDAEVSSGQPLWRPRSGRLSPSPRPLQSKRRFQICFARDDGSEAFTLPSSAASSLTQVTVEEKPLKSFGIFVTFLSDGTSAVASYTSAEGAAHTVCRRG